MPLVLYPDDLRTLGRVYDDLCDELVSHGVEFSREVLAQRILAEAYGSKFIVSVERLVIHPESSTQH
jgi:hypothetical protein